MTLNTAVKVRAVVAYMVGARNYLLTAIAKEMLNVNRSSKFNCGNVKYWWTLLRNNSKIGARAWGWF